MYIGLSMTSASRYEFLPELSFNATNNRQTIVDIDLFLGFTCYNVKF